MGDDLSEFEALMPKKGPRCSVGVALVALAPAERRKVLAALAAPQITSPAIVRWFKQKGNSISPSSVNRHRRGECSCD